MERVLLFGSALHRKRFHRRSDIDLAVWGLDEGDYLRAVVAVLDLDPQIEVELVRWEAAPESLQARILDESVPL